VSPTLTALLALQDLDSAADAARRRVAEMPAAEAALADALKAAGAAADAVKAKLQENAQARRNLEKDVAGVDVRLARFDDHKAAVKTNQEYTALLHEIATAKAEKDEIEERLLVLMEEGDGLAGELKAAEAAVAAETARGNELRTAMAAERQSLEAELDRIASQRQGASAGVAPRTLALYEQLIKGRRGIAMARMDGELCVACHVRLRPHIAQLVRRNDDIHQCESCQRILYYVAPESGDASAS
jgi:predicted  nucleic acid-binding Zn-ribbon protein